MERQGEGEKKNILFLIIDTWSPSP